MSLKCRPGAALFSRRVRSTHFFILLGLIAITPVFSRPHTDASLSFGAAWGFGSLEYDLRSPDTGSGVASRLDFPLDGLHPSLELTVARTEADHTFSSGTVSLSMNVAGPYGLMTDYDWNILSGIPPVPFSYTESPVSAVDFTARGALTWFPFHPGSADIGWQIGYSFQSIYQEIKGYNGWVYQWNSSTSSYDLKPQSGTGTVLTYQIYLHAASIGLAYRQWLFPRARLSVAADFLGVAGFDSDDHLLRTKLSTAWAVGPGYRADMWLVFFSAGNGQAGGPFHLSVGGSVTGFSLFGRQTQTWYGSADAGNGAPQGTVLSNIYHHVSSLQARAGIAASFTF